MEAPVPKTGYITARIDESLKIQGDKILRKVGVTPTDLMTMVYHQVVLRGGVPFDVRLPNKSTRKAMRELDDGNGERYDEPTGEAFDKMTRSSK